MIPRRTPLRATTPLARTSELRRASAPLNRTTPPLSAGTARTRKPIRPVSVRRQRENRERRAMVAKMFGGEVPLCFVPWCGQWADDLHEPLSRARGGSITDPENATPLCRAHHDQVTFRPESELQWAYDLGLLRHSWDAERNGAA